MAQPSLYEGTPDQLVQHLKRLPHTRTYHMTVTPTTQEDENETLHPESQAEETMERFRRLGLRGVGMFAHVAGGSEAFAKEKQAEMDREDYSRA